MKVLGVDSSVSIGEYGGKAVGLWDLRSLGLPVPPTVALTADEAANCDAEFATRVLEALRCDVDGPTGFAVRSSSKEEDTPGSSGAGHFESLLLEPVDFDGPGGLADAIKRTGHQRGQKISVVVQPLLQSSFGGAAFGLDVRDLGRARFTIAWTRGSPAELLAGVTAGETVFLPFDGDLPRDLDPGLLAVVPAIEAALRAGERATGQPVDLEWIVPPGSSDATLVQMRPVVLPAASDIDLADGPAIAQLPAGVRAHPKLQIRQAALRTDVAMSRGRLFLRAGPADQDLMIEGALAPSEDAALSVVLVFPRTTEGKVVRTFVGTSSASVEGMVAECHRYAIRSYPEARNVDDTLRRTLAIGLRDRWMASAVVMEVLPFRLTGMIARSGAGFAVEIAEGHFVPKGFVPTSLYFVGPDGDVVTQQRQAAQELALRIVSGHLIEERPVEMVAQTHELIRSIAMALEPLVRDPSVGAVEFGVVFTEGRPMTYAIDAADAGTDSIPGQDLVLQGVLSPGRARGQVTVLGDGSLDDSIDSHIFDGREGSGLHDRVFVADRPALALLEIVYAAEPSCAFIFREASILSHLVVVLRERGIPAVAVGARVDELTEGMEVAVDAASGDLPPKDRVR